MRRGADACRAGQNVAYFFILLDRNSEFGAIVVYMMKIMRRERPKHSQVTDYYANY